MVGEDQNPASVVSFAFSSPQRFNTAIADEPIVLVLKHSVGSAQMGGYAVTQLIGYIASGFENDNINRTDFVTLLDSSCYTRLDKGDATIYLSEVAGNAAVLIRQLAQILFWSS